MELVRTQGYHIFDLLSTSTSSLQFIHLSIIVDKKGSRRASRNRKKRLFCSSYSFLQSRVLVAPSGYMFRIIGIYCLTQCSPYSHCQSSVHGALSFRYSSRPRCFAAACWFRLRSRVLRPEDACQTRFSWFSDWSPKVQKYVKTHKCNSCRFGRELSNDTLLAKIGFGTVENGPRKVCQKIFKS